MATSNLLTPQLLGNLTYGINRRNFVGLEERDNLIHAFLSDCAYYITTQLNIKTTVRTYDDEFYNIQLDGVELLITYYPISNQEDWKINDCGVLGLDYEVYYKMEAKSDNKSKIKEVATIINMLMCRNFNGGVDWSYTDTTKLKRYTTCTNLNASNKLLTETPMFTQIIETNFLYLKQTYSLLFTKYLI